MCLSALFGRRPRWGLVCALGGRTMQPDDSAKRSRHDSIENKLCQELERQVGPRNFEHWFRDKTSLTAAGDSVTVGVASPFLLNWMQKHFRDELHAAVQAVLGPAAQVVFEVDGRLSLEPKNGSHGEKTAQKSAGRPQHASDRANSSTIAGGGRRFADLADFVSGRSNELALTAARQICQSPGSEYNPLFVYGSVGIGKTHLLEGIYRRIRRQFPALQTMYLTAETFANYFTQALREHTLPGFRQRFRNVDVFLVDDIDFLDSKRVIQEEFLHTFQQLESHGRQIVLSADRHPRLLMKIRDDLTTRFLSGLVCRIETPDVETRRQIVERIAAKSGASISTEARSFVAQRFKNSVRELEGAINCLATFHKMTGKRIGVSGARNVLADLERDCIRIVRMSDVEETVCTFFGVEPKDLRSPRRHRSVSQPRMLAMYLARKHTQAAYSEIGEYFGGRNHSTVMSAERKVRTLLKERTAVKVSSQTWSFDEIVETLEQRLQAS